MVSVIESADMEQEKREGFPGRRRLQYETIYEYVSQRITTGHYELNELLPTEESLAGQFGVSRPTVAKAMRLLRDEGMVMRRPGLGTFVTKKVEPHLWNVGLVVPGLGDVEIYEPMCRAIATTAQQENLRLYWTSTPAGSMDQAARIRAIAQQCMDQRLEGVFLAPLDQGPHYEDVNAGIVDQFTSMGMRVVLLDHDITAWPHQSACDWVGIDHMQAGFLMTEHLLQQGCRRLLFAKPYQQAGSSLLRWMGCREAVLQAGLPSEAVRLCEVDREDLETTVQTFRQEDVDGVIGANDALAALLLRALLDQGVRVPEHIQVVGFDDVRYASLLSVPLTTYHMPAEEIGRQAAHLMHMRLRHPERPARRVSLFGEVVVRRSSRV